MNLSHAYGVRPPPPPGRGRGAAAAALDLGVTLFDTAALYGFGANETLVGRVLKRAPRASRCAARAAWPACRRRREARDRRPARGHPAATAKTACSACSTDHIDLYYLHRWDKQVPIEDSGGRTGATWCTRRQGACTGPVEVSAATLRRAHAVHPIAAVQTEYSLWTRNPEIAVLQACREHRRRLRRLQPAGARLPDRHAARRGDAGRQGPAPRHAALRARDLRANLALLAGLRGHGAARPGCTPGAAGAGLGAGARVIAAAAQIAHSVTQLVIVNTAAPDRPAPTAQPPAACRRSPSHGADDVAAHAGAAAEAFELELAEQRRGQEGPEQDAGHQPQIEVGRLVAGEEHARQHLGRGAGEAQRLDRVRLEGRLDTPVGEPPGGGNGRPTPMAPAQPQAGTFWRRAQNTAATSQTMPNRSGRRRGRCRCGRSGRGRHRRPPSTSRRWPRASGDSMPGPGRLRRDGEDQPRHHRAQVALRGQHQQPAGAAARQDHAHAEQRTADGRARQAAAGGDLARIGWHRRPAGQRQRLRRHHGGGKGEQPDRELAAVVARANSMTAERRQKRERCAKKPKARPISKPPAPASRARRAGRSRPRSCIPPWVKRGPTPAHGLDLGQAARPQAGFQGLM
jgi:aryl-alcohol dehydrogenase-like predicted oxidoreductase